MDTESKAIIDFIVNWAQSRGDTVELIYGFGSFFNGRAREGSDVDLAILTQKKSASRMEVWELQNQLAQILRKEIDLIDLKSAPIVLKFQIVTEGMNIFCSDQSARDFFETYVYSAYFKFQEERKEIVGDVLKRKSVYGYLPT